jgi:hypothetical protein
MSDPNKGKDDPRTAPESGDAQDSGRNRGQVVGAEDALEEREKAKADPSKEHWESGRTDAAPRSGD